MTVLPSFSPLRKLAGLFIALVAATPFAAAENPDPLRPMPTSSTVSALAGPLTKSSERLREGTKLIDVTGTFQAVGADNISFLANGNKESYRLLQNLALQRISQSLEDNRALRQWTVSGTITEFRSANYLLVTKAVQSPDAPAVASP